MQKNCLLLIVVFFASSCTANTQQSAISESEFIFQSNVIVKSITNTPYSALIRLTSIETVDLPDADKSDDFSEQQFIYNADVIETYRGEIKKTISYMMLVEKSEKADFSKVPFIITLCTSNEGFYWPGVGASFSADSRLITLAKKAAEQTDNKQTLFNDCE